MTHGVRELRRTAGRPALRYVDTGPGTAPAVVLLHSLGADHRMWEPQLDALAGEHRVLAWDSRGHGASGWQAPLGVADWSADLCAVLEHAGAPRAALVGVSMGGVQAMATALAHPELVSGLVLADTFAELDPAVAQAKTDGLVRRARADGMAALARSYVEETFTTSPDEVDREPVRAAIAGMTADAYVASTAACFGARLGDRIPAIAVPTLVLWGERDTKTPRPLSERIAADVPGAELLVVPDAGHLSNLENPDAFTAQVRRFLKKAT